VAANAGQAALNPVTNKIYVSGSGSNKVTVIDGATNTTTTVTDPNASSPFALEVNPVTNKIYVANFQSNNVTVIDGATNTTTTVKDPNVGSPTANGPFNVAVNPVTNKIYVANANGSVGSVTVIDGATNATTTIVDPKAIDPFQVAVNQVTNKIYVVNSNNNVTVIDGATNAITNVPLVATGTTAYVINLNPLTNKIYVGVLVSSGSITVIDGATNTTTTINDPNSIGPGIPAPNAIAVSPVTNNVYIANQASNTVTVLTEQNVQAIPLTTTITPLPGNQTSNPTPTFTFSAASTFAPTAPTVDALYFQVDTWQGSWTSATSNGGGNFTGTTTALQAGFHFLYAYATDGQDASSIETAGNGIGESSPLVGAIAAYGFLVTPPPTAPGFSPSPASIAFGNQAQGVKSAAMSVTITNSGNANLTFTTVTITGTNKADFAISADTCSGQTVAASANCSVSATFTPSTGGAESAALSFPDNAAASPQTVGLSGTGVTAAPGATFAPTSLTFAGQVVTSSSTAQTITLTNSGNVPLNITSIAITGANSGDFSQTNTCGSSVAASANCTISVTFKPTGTGNRAASITVTDNAANSPQNVALTGTGTDFSIDVASGGSATASVTAGGTATYNLQVTPAGGFNAAVAITCTGAPSESTCTPSSGSITPNGTVASAFSVSATTTAPSIVAPGAEPRDWRPLDRLRFVLPFLLAFILFALAARFREVAARRPRGFVYSSALGFFLLAGLVTSGCNGGSSKVHNPGTPKGTYTLTVTGTANGVIHTQTLTLTVN